MEFSSPFSSVQFYHKGVVYPPGGTLVVDRTGFSSGIITPGEPTNSPVKGFTDGLNGLRRGDGFSGCSSPNSKLEAILYCFWGVLGEVELARDSLEEVTEAESESEKMLLDMPPGGLRTLLWTFPSS